MATKANFRGFGLLQPGILSPVPAWPAARLTTRGVLCLGLMVIDRPFRATAQDHPEVTACDIIGPQRPSSPVKGHILGPSLLQPLPCPQFLRDTLAVVSDNTWICQLSLEMCRQLPCYNGTPQEKVHDAGGGCPRGRDSGQGP